MALIKDFECTGTGKRYALLGYKTKIVNGVPKYFRSGPGWEELKSPDGFPYKKIDPETIHLTAIKTADGMKAQQDGKS